MSDLEMKIRIGAELKEIRTALGQLQGDLKRTGQAGKDAGKTAGAGMDGLSSQIKSLKRQAAAFIGVWASLSTLKGLSRLADEYKELNARLKLVSKSQEEFTSNQENLLAIAQRTRSELSSTIDLYARIARSTKELNVSQADRLKVTEAINQAIKVSGASQESANAAVIQLGQGLASGVLRGEELNSVLEQTPRLAEAIAAGMGRSLGELRQLGAEGKLTSEQIIKALIDQSEAINTEYQQIPVTISGAITTIRNEFITWIGTTDQAYGATKTLADGLLFLGRNFKEVIETALRLGGILTTAYAVKGVNAVRAYITEVLTANAATATLNKTVTGLQRGFQVLAAGVIGWQIGSYLREQFLVVEQAGIAMMGGLQETWERLVAFFERSAAYLRYILQSPFGGLREKVAEFYQDMADIAEKIPKIGKDIADGLRQAGNFVKPMSHAAKQYRTEISKINADLKAEIEGINDIYSDLMRKAEENRRSRTKAPTAPSTTPSSTATDQKKAIVADQVALAKGEVDTALRELERLKSESLVSFADYYTRRRELQLQQIDLEIAANKKALESAARDEQKAKILADIITLEKRRGEIATEASRGQAAAERDLARELEKVKENLLKLQGKDAEARQLALERQYKDLIQRLQVEGDTTGEQLVRSLINTEVAHAQLSELQTKFSQAISEMRAEEQSTQARLDTGEISSSQAEEEIVSIREQQLSQMQKLIQMTRELAKETKDPAIIQALKAMEREYANAADKVNEVSDQVKDNLKNSIGQGLIDLADGAKNLKEVFRDMAVSVLRMLQEIVAKKLATQIVTSVATLFHSGGIVGSGGTIRAINPALIGAAPRYHAGGIAGLAPGEVPAILERGEEVLTRDDPRHVGNLQGQAAGSLKTIIIDDRDSVGDYMSSAAGEKVQIETIRRNSGVIKRILG